MRNMERVEPDGVVIPVALYFGKVRMKNEKDKIHNLYPNNIIVQILAVEPDMKVFHIVMSV